MEDSLIQKGRVHDLLRNRAQLRFEPSVTQSWAGRPSLKKAPPSFISMKGQPSQGQPT